MAAKTIFYNIFLWWSVLGMSIWVGGTVFSMTVVVPMWSHSAPESVRFFFGQTSFNKYIWNFFGPPWMVMRILPVFLALIIGWNLRPQREYLFIAALSIIFGIVFTLAYVYPINDILMTKAGGDKPPEEIKALVYRWIFADRLRFIIMLIGYIFLLIAFRLQTLKSASL